MRRISIAAMGVVVIGVHLAYSSCPDRVDIRQTVSKTEAVRDSAGEPRRLDSYTIKGMTFTYCLIRSGLSREALMAAAQALHDSEPKAQLILVDDTRQLQEYINYAKEFSRGNLDAYFPLEWAKQHVIANVQKFISGKYKLCRGMFGDEIADLK
jgi:hypothetical protein